MASNESSQSTYDLINGMRKDGLDDLRSGDFASARVYFEMALLGMDNDSGTMEASPHDMEFLRAELHLLMAFALLYENLGPTTSLAGMKADQFKLLLSNVSCSMSGNLSLRDAFLGAIEEIEITTALVANASEGVRRELRQISDSMLHVILAAQAAVREIRAEHENENLTNDPGAPLSTPPAAANHHASVGDIRADLGNLTIGGDLPSSSPPAATSDATVGNLTNDGALPSSSPAAATSDANNTDLDNRP